MPSAAPLECMTSTKVAQSLLRPASSEYAPKWGPAGSKPFGKTHYVIGVSHLTKLDNVWIICANLEEMRARSTGRVSNMLGAYANDVKMCGQRLYLHFHNEFEHIDISRFFFKFYKKKFRIRITLEECVGNKLDFPLTSSK